MAQQAVIRGRENGHWKQIEGCKADASFDAVLASHMLYHVSAPRAALAEIARVITVQRYGRDCYKRDL